MNSIRTDLALEAKELYEEQKQADIPGVEAESEMKEDIKVSRIRIVSPLGEERLGKPQGRYITIEAPRIKDRDPEYKEKLSKQLAEEIKKLVNLNKDDAILIVGLGNWNITPDSLGPKVVEKVMVTRHIMEFMPDQVDERLRPVCAVAPGVLGITGIETGDIIKGIVAKIKPQLVIAIDALASRKTDRIGNTIQIADTGIVPGSGIGNKRIGLNENTLGVKTLAIGVPTVVYAYTIGRDSIKLLINEFSNQAIPGSAFYRVLQQMNEDHLDVLVKQVLASGLGELVVTPKEIDMLIEDMADIISDGLNLSLHENLTLEEVSRFLH